MSFGIVGIKILRDCAPYIRKRLREGEVYLLSSRYEVDKSNELLLSIKRKDDKIFFAESLYDIQNESGSSIEVSNGIEDDKIGLTSRNKNLITISNGE